jgi:hypothetical protein
VEILQGEKFVGGGNYSRREVFGVFTKFSGQIYPGGRRMISDCQIWEIYTGIVVDCFTLQSSEYWKARWKRSHEV